MQKNPLKLREEFIIEIKNDEKNVNKQIFKEYFFIRLHSIIFRGRII